MSFYGGKVAFITGASAGIGLALAEEMHRRGAHVVLAARREDRLKEIAEKLSTKGPGRAVACACDVTKDGDVEKALALAKQTLGKVDIVVANAGFGVVGDFTRLKVDDYRRQFETNIYGVIRTAQAAIRSSKRRRDRSRSSEA